MPRYIDTLPTPAHVEPKKLVVLSAPRTGTHGLYMALKQLGFRPYHMVEVLSGGPPAMKIMEDGMNAEFFHEGTPYTRAEFDKWFADYDVIIEMPFWTLHSVLKAYPDAKFLLMERDPDKWASSFINTVGQLIAAYQSLPLSIFKYFDDFSWCMGRWGTRVVDYCTNGHGNSPKGKECLVRNYKDYIAEVKRLVPPERLKVCKLEDGFGWSEICTYLEVPEPGTDWPPMNQPEQFRAIIEPKIMTAFRKGVAGLSAVVVPVTAMAFWYMRRGKLPFLS
ncbi:P-loop containing nucleoside triphosphate hydrolase protein [Xylariaceae sp. FL0016]|nr:P-loop containing nucleoside triphosphate hydrolase protein [Xylariaceae sp. FL0016]